MKSKALQHFVLVVTPASLERPVIRSEIRLARLTLDVLALRQVASERKLNVGKRAGPVSRQGWKPARAETPSAPCTTARPGEDAHNSTVTLVC
jgi:hypothetical protein